MNKTRSNIKYFLEILSISKKWKWLLIGIIAFCLISNIASIIGPKYLGDATDQLIYLVHDGASSGGFALIDSCLLIALLYYIISNLFMYLLNQTGIILSQKICYYLRDQLIWKISKLPYSFFETHKSGDITSRFTNDVDLIGENFASVFISVISAITTLIGIYVGMFLLNASIALALFILLLVILVATIIIVKFSQKYYTSQQENLGKFNGFINESYFSQKVIMSYNCGAAFKNTFNDFNERLFKDGLYSSFLSRIIYTINNLFYLLSFSIVILFGVKLISDNTLTIGDLQTFLMYSFLLSLPLSETSSVLNLGQQIVAAGKRIFDFLDEDELDTSNLYINKSKINKFDINVNSLNFKYNEDKPVLKDISLDIPELSRVAIVGHTGSGKTTISKLLLGFYDNYEGSLLIGGSEVKNIYKNDLREIIGIIPQDVWIHSGTIAQNISLENGNIDYDKVKWSAKMACIDSFIENLPDKYNHEIDENFDNLSLGQLQLINVARAFYSNKKIIIFDEATSYIDFLTETMVQKAINNLSQNKTIIIIAHRLTTVEECDNIFVLQNGSLVEQGNHNSLLKRKSVYYELYNSRLGQNEQQ